MKYLEYLFAGYAVIWVVLFLYTSGLASQQRKLSREVELLRRAVEDKGARG